MALIERDLALETIIHRKRAITTANLHYIAIGAIFWNQRITFFNVNRINCLSENRLGKGDSPILLRGLRKIGTVPDGSRIGSKPT